jgi:hypothetical protein
MNDNKSDNMSGISRHYPVAYLRKSAGLFPWGDDSAKSLRARSAAP